MTFYMEVLLSYHWWLLRWDGHVGYPLLTDKTAENSELLNQRSQLAVRNWQDQTTAAGKSESVLCNLW